LNDYSNKNNVDQAVVMIHPDNSDKVNKSSATVTTSEYTTITMNSTSDENTKEKITASLSTNGTASAALPLQSPPTSSSSNSFITKIKNDPSTLYKWCTESNIKLEQIVSVVVLSIGIMIPLRDTIIVQIVIYWLVHPFYHLLLRIIGVAIGIGFGLGLAAHVYDQLDAWKLAEEQQKLALLYEMDDNGGYYSSDDDDFVTDTAGTSTSGGGRHNSSSVRQHLRRRLKNGVSFGLGRKKLSPRSLWIRDRQKGGNTYTSSSSSLGWDASGRRIVTGSARTVRHENTIHSSNNYEDDEQTYSSLMKSAGYSFVFFTSSNINSNATSPTQQQHQQQQPRLRGQVIRSDNLNFQNRLYHFAETRISENDNMANNKNDTDPNSDNRSNDGSRSFVMDLESEQEDNDNNSFDDESNDTLHNENSFSISVPVPISKAVTCMNNMWPTLPNRINEELGRAIEYIVRDFIALWFCKCDMGCVYDDPEITLKEKKKKMAKAASRHQRNRQQQQQVSGDQQRLMMNEYSYYYNKRMLYSMATYRPLPFIDSLYDSMTVIFGNLATRVENINLFELVLLKWVQVLAHTFKVYRSLRKNVLKIQQQQQTTTSSKFGIRGSLQFTLNNAEQQQLQQAQSQSTRNNVSSTTGSTMGTTTTTPSPSTNNDNNSTTATASVSTTGTVSAISKAATQRVKILRHTLSRIRATSSSAAETAVSDAVGYMDSTTTSNDARDETMSMSSFHGGSVGTATNASVEFKRPKQSNQQQQSSIMSSTQPPVPSKYVPVSEMSMTKEFLFAGKLHKAVTFGLDVNAFLFSDSTGRDCGVPLTDDEKKILGNKNNDIINNNAIRLTDNDVLERRLFNTPLITECELDYNRVLGHRIVRTLIPRADYSCLIVRSLLTEIMGGSVLNPIMSIFSPEYINSWIIAGLVSSSSPPEIEQQAGTNNTTTSTTTTTTTTPDLVGEVVTMNTKKSTATDSSSAQRVLPNSKRPLDQIVIADKGDDGTDTFEVQVNATHDRGSSAPIVDSTIQSTELLETASCDDGEPTYIGEEIQLQGHDVEQDESATAIDRIYTQLAMALIDLQRFVDFDEFRNSRTTNTPYKVDWDTPECRTAAIRLVLVIEAALSHGRCIYKPRASTNQSIDSRSIDEFDEDDNDFNSYDGDAIDAADQGPSSITTIIDFPDVQLSQVLMELTSDMDAFEDKIETLLELEDEKRVYEDKYSCMVAQSYQPSAQEQSTMRTLIAAWLHSGQAYRAISLLMKAQTTVLAPFYRHAAFLRNRETSGAFLRQFAALVDVGILVDTMSVLGVPRLEDSDPELLASLMAKSTGGVSTLHPFTNEQRLTDQTRSPSNVNSPLAASSQYTNNASTAIPRYLDFNRNESFAASLRTERERRLASWERLMNEEIYGAEGYNEPLPIICSAGNRNDEEHLVLHRELHHLARIFYTGTNMIAIRDASRRKSNPTPIEGLGDASVESSSIDDLQQVSLVTVETACSRRRLEVPDDDSSFLLRAQVSFVLYRSIYVFRIDFLTTYFIKAASAERCWGTSGPTKS
jgi:PXA domain